MKKFIIGFIVGALMFSIIPVMAQEGLTVVPNPFPVLIDGVVTEVEGYNINGYTFLKLADFGKAGLTVKFNETDKQIEISSTKKAVITPEPIPDKGDDVVSDVEKFEENGYQGIRVDGVEYYLLKSIDDAIRSNGYLFYFKPNTKKWALVNSKDNVMLNEVPYTIFNDNSYIVKGYYLNTILPIVQGGE
jgi:hypothetical protein